MTATTTEQIQQLAAALESDVTNAALRVEEAEGALKQAQSELEQAKSALVEIQRQREGFQRTFGGLLGGGAAESEHPTLQLEKRGTAKAVAAMTILEKLIYVLGDRTLSLGEIEAELKALKAPASRNSMSAVLCGNKDRFASPARGSWKLTHPEGVVVLSQTEAQHEMLSRRRSG